MRTAPLIALLTFACQATLAADHYRIRFDKDLAGVQVHACFDGAAPRLLERSQHAAQYTDWIRHDGEPLEARVVGDRLELPALPDDACIDWRVKLAAAASGRDYRTAYRAGDAIVASLSLWFWQASQPRPSEVRVMLPAGMSFSAPWPAADQAGELRFKPEMTPPQWSAHMAVGRFPTARLEAPGSSVRMAMPGFSEGADTARLKRWIEGSLDAVASVFGFFPRPTLQVLIVPAGRHGGPVAFAHVLRGGGPAAEFFIDPKASEAELRGDWKATHEFSHLLLPFVSEQDRWLSEGLASYYQNVLRARDGRLSEAQAWQELHDGFLRGAREAGSLTLAAATRHGRANTMRVYWSGAAMLLLADTRLRERSGGEQNLDTALRAFNRCCLGPERSWRARDLFGELDRLTGLGVFGEIYRDNVYADGFPDFTKVFQALGIDIENSEVRLQDNAPLADLRREIMSPAAPG